MVSARWGDCSTAKKSMDLLKEIFGNRVISLRGKVVWSARSPDLSPCDFFLWRFLKAKVYEQSHTTLFDLFVPQIEVYYALKK